MSANVPRDVPSDGSYGEYRDVEPGQDDESAVAYMRAVHAARAFGPGKILVRRTGETLPSGEGVFAFVEPAGTTGSTT